MDVYVHGKTLIVVKTVKTVKTADLTVLADLAYFTHNDDSCFRFTRLRSYHEFSGVLPGSFVAGEIARSFGQFFD